jgi:thiol-disulfide isomerase/thioredoxin
MVSKIYTKRKRVGNSKTRKNKQPVIVGKIYANWCGYCKTIAPIWKSLKNDYALKEIKFLEFEYANKTKLEKFKAKSVSHSKLTYTGYPTLFKYDNNEYNYYKGPQDKNSIKKWVLGKN